MPWHKELIVHVSGAKKQGEAKWESKSEWWDQSLKRGERAKMAFLKNVNEPIKKWPEEVLGALNEETKKASEKKFGGSEMCGAQHDCICMELGEWWVEVQEREKRERERNVFGVQKVANAEIGRAHV